MEEMSRLYAEIINEYKFKYQLNCLVLFKKHGEDDEITNQIELPITLSITHNLIQSEIDNIKTQWSLDNRIQSIEMKEAGLSYQRINSMSISFYKSGEMNGSSYVKIPLRPNALVNIRNDDKCCFIWSILASLHPFNEDHLNVVSNYKQYFRELNIQGFDFSNGFKCSDMHKFEKTTNFSNNIFELNFFQEQNKCKHKLIPIQTSENERDRITDLTQQFIRIIMLSLKT